MGKEPCPFRIIDAIAILVAVIILANVLFLASLAKYSRPTIRGIHRGYGIYLQFILYPCDARNAVGFKYSQSHSRVYDICHSKSILGIQKTPDSRIHATYPYNFSSDSGIISIRWNRNFSIAYVKIKESHFFKKNHRKREVFWQLLRLTNESVLEPPL